MKIENIEKEYEYLGIKCKSINSSFRMKNLDEVLRISNEWMKSTHGDTFVGFELREDLDNNYIARLKGDKDSSHLDNSCFIRKVKTQWRANLYHRKLL